MGLEEAVGLSYPFFVFVAFSAAAEPMKRAEGALYAPSGGSKGEAGEAGIRGTWGDGVPMAKNLVKAGHDLAVWNRTGRRDGALVEAGAQWVGRPAYVARGARAVVLMLADAEAIREVLFDKWRRHRGVAREDSEIDMSTMGAADSVARAGALHELGHFMLDAPVSGNVSGAEAGTLAIMVGGEETVLEYFRPALETMGDEIFHLGSSGSGTRMKLVLNLIAVANLAVLAEGLGEAVGITGRKGRRSAYDGRGSLRYVRSKVRRHPLS